MQKLQLNTDDLDVAERATCYNVPRLLQPIMWDKLKERLDDMPDTRCDLPIGLQDYH